LLSASSAERGAWYQLWWPLWRADNAFDNDPQTTWLTNDDAQQVQYLALDLGSEQTLAAFTYLPRQDYPLPEGMIEAGYLEVSDNGVHWKTLEAFEFGNLLNDPVQRTHYFQQPVTTRYIKIVSTHNVQGSAAAGAAEIGFLPAKMPQ